MRNYSSQSAHGYNQNNSINDSDEYIRNLVNKNVRIYLKL